ncbi:hypothetical protein [Paenibacillus pini]|uniref:Uncharacterized protein n=1 Tax=Paenibacillus pini JCM 16418 TaxID=1236976 RepID=W7YZN9_9BACL|nr:hypothetical protein [Paenibacillus pini]GAF07854.1 hypothetical protein JCM16418_1886 [Paenibacillus pini JCM 16418]
MKELEKIEKLRTFINLYIDKFEDEGSEGSDFKIPEFDLYARDYLGFAENQIKIGTTEARINCISNLKRAVDCQIDTFLFSLSIYEVFKKRNLKFERKLELVEAIGVFNSNSLAKLNKIRNKMEHEYTIPDINEIDLYFDLVSAFVSNLESVITVLTWDEMNFNVYNEEGEFELFFNLKLERGAEQKIVAKWIGKRELNEIIEVSFNEYKCYGFYLRCLYLLNIRNVFASNKYVKDEITKSYNKLCNPI